MINETSDSPFPTSGSTLGSSGSTSGASSMGSTMGTSTGASTGTLGGGASSSTSGMPYEAGASAPAAVHRMARAAHEAVDRLEQTLGSGSERMMDWQQEYGEMARDQVRSNPLAAIGVAFGVGIIFSKLFMR